MKLFTQYLLLLAQHALIHYQPVFQFAKTIIFLGYSLRCNLI